MFARNYCVARITDAVRASVTGKTEEKGVALPPEAKTWPRIDLVPGS